MKIEKINKYFIFIIFILFILFIVLKNNYYNYNSNDCGCCKDTSNKKENFATIFGKTFNTRTRLLTSLKHPVRQGIRSLSNFENLNIDYGINRIKHLFS